MSTNKPQLDWKPDPYVGNGFTISVPIKIDGPKESLLLWISRRSKDANGNFFET